MSLVGFMSIRRILRYLWHAYMSRDLVLREAGLIQITCIIRERQLRFLGIWLDSLRSIPPMKFFSHRDPNEWTKPEWRPQA